MMSAGLVLLTVGAVVLAEVMSPDMFSTTMNWDSNIEECEVDYSEVYTKENACWFDLTSPNCNDCNKCLYPIIEVVQGKDELKCVSKHMWITKCTDSRFTFELNGRLACSKCHSSCEQCYGREANECLNCQLGDISDDQWVDYWPDGSCKKLQQIEKPESI